MRPALRKLNLTAHVSSSVGWLGAVAGFLVLAIAGVVSRDPETVRGAYLSMNVLGQFLIVPLSFAALLTGLIESLGTHWGLFRHYWVLTKFTLTVAATALLLLHQFVAVEGAAKLASLAPVGTLPDVGRLGPQLVGDASLALVTLLVTTTLSIYKPWGRTPYGRRKREEERLGVPAAAAEAMPLSMKIMLAVVAAIIATIVVVHLAGGGMRHG